MSKKNASKNYKKNIKTKIKKNLVCSQKLEAKSQKAKEILLESLRDPKTTKSDEVFC